MKSFIKSHRLSLSLDRFGEPDHDSSFQLSSGFLNPEESKSNSINNLPSNRRRSEYYTSSKTSSDLYFSRSPVLGSPSNHSLKKFNPINYIRKRCVSEENNRSAYVPSVEEYKEAGAIFGTRVHNWDSRLSTPRKVSLNTAPDSVDTGSERPSGLSPNNTTNFNSTDSGFVPSALPNTCTLSDTKISADPIERGELLGERDNETPLIISSAIADNKNKDIVRDVETQYLQNASVDCKPCLRNDCGKATKVTKVFQTQPRNSIGSTIEKQNDNSKSLRNFDEPLQEIDYFIRQSLALNSDDDMNSLFDKTSIASPKTPNTTTALNFGKRSISKLPTVDSFNTETPSSLSDTTDSIRFGNSDEPADNQDACSEFSFEEDKSTGRTPSFKFYYNPSKALQVYPGPPKKAPKRPISYAKLDLNSNTTGNGLQNGCVVNTNGSLWTQNETIDFPVAPLKWTSSRDTLNNYENDSNSQSDLYLNDSAENDFMDSDCSSNYEYESLLDEVNAIDDYSAEFHDASSYCCDISYQDSILSRNSKSSFYRGHQSSRRKDLIRQHSIVRKIGGSPAAARTYSTSKTPSKLSNVFVENRNLINNTRSISTPKFDLPEQKEIIMQNIAPPTISENPSLMLV